MNIVDYLIEKTENHYEKEKLIQGITLIQNDDFDEAEELFTQFIESYPTNIAGYIFLEWSFEGILTQEEFENMYGYLEDLHVHIADYADSEVKKYTNIITDKMYLEQAQTYFALNHKKTPLKKRLLNLVYGLEKLYLVDDPFAVDFLKSQTEREIAELREKLQSRKKKNAKTLVLITTITCIVVLSVFVYTQFIVKIQSYNKGMDFVMAEEYALAVPSFNEAGNYKDACMLADKYAYKVGRQLYDQGKFSEARRYFGNAAGYADALDFYYALSVEPLYGNNGGTFTSSYSALNNKGEIYTTAYEASEQYEMMLNMNDIISSRMGMMDSFVLDNTGTLFKKYRDLDYEEIPDVLAFTKYVVLKTDGTVHSSEGKSSDRLDLIKKWDNIVDLSEPDERVFGLNVDGTVEDSLKWNDTDFEEVKHWTDIIEMFADTFFVVGLKADGTMVISGEYAPDFLIPAVASLKDVRQACITSNNIIAVHFDGTVSHMTSDYISTHFFETLKGDEAGTLYYFNEDTNIVEQMDLSNYDNIVYAVCTTSGILMLNEDGKTISGHYDPKHAAFPILWSDIILPHSGGFISKYTEDGELL